MKNNKKIYSFFPFLACIIVVMITINGYDVLLEYNNYMETSQRIKDKVVEDKWEVLSTLIQDEYDDINADIKYLAKKIEAQILIEYGSELPILEEEMSQCILSQRLYDILKKEIVDGMTAENIITDPKNYNFILGFRDKIFASFKNSDDVIIGEYHGSLSWADYFRNDFNTDMTESLVTAINDRNTNNKLLLYTGQRTDNILGPITDSMEYLKRTYERYGLEGFKTIDLINVGYITESGDIFGNPDFIYLTKNDNYKIIIVQRTNLYDLISDFSLHLSHTIESKYYIAQDKLDSFMSNMLGNFVVNTGLLIITVMVFCIIYNRHIDENDEHELIPNEEE